MPTYSPVSKSMGDIVIREWDHLHSREGVLITNASAAAFADKEMLGLPIKNLTRVDADHYTADIAVAADLAAVIDGIIVSPGVESLAAAGETTNRYACVVRGPVVLNKDKIAQEDPAEAAYNMDAAILAGLLPLGIVCRDEPPTGSLIS